MVYHYYVKVVPTMYVKLSGEVRLVALITNNPLTLKLTHNPPTQSHTQSHTQYHIISHNTIQPYHTILSASN